MALGEPPGLRIVIAPLEFIEQPLGTAGQFANTFTSG